MPVTLYGIVGPDGGSGGTPWPFDTSDFMRKSVYDKDNDGIVDKIKKLIHIEELSTGYSDGLIPKTTIDGDSSWEEDISMDIEVVDGGTF